MSILKTIILHGVPTYVKKVLIGKDLIKRFMICIGGDLNGGPVLLF